MRGNAWWNEVSGPSRFLNAAAREVAAQKSIVLRFPKNIPFEDDFYDLLENKIACELPGQLITPLEGISGTIGDYFLNVYCKKELRASFRPKPGFTAAKFLAASPTSVMHGRGFIVRINDLDEYRMWAAFVSEYSQSVTREIMPAVFVICVEGEDIPKASKGLKIISYSDYSTHFDSYAYCIIQASDISEPAIIKEYLAELAALLSNGNAELSAKAMHIYREFLEDPASFAVKHLDQREGEKESLIRKVWEAQLKCIYPHIERFRCDFVGKHEKELSPQIGTLKHPFGAPYESAKDIELGTLNYMSHNGMLDLERDEYDTLKAFYIARNKLAHMVTLEYKEIRQLLC